MSKTMDNKCCENPLSSYLSRASIFFIFLFCLGCEELEQVDTENTTELFSIVNPIESKVVFKNQLKENLLMNGLFYEYYYNGAGVAIEDFNDDGLMDIYFISNLESNRLYLNKGNMKFQDVTSISGLNGKYGFPGGVTTTDINGDGKIDIYICKSGKFENKDVRQNELYINAGNNKQGIPVFKERASEYGLDLPHFSTQAAFFDYDKDDDLDMFIINHGIEVYSNSQTKLYIDKPTEFRAARLYKNENGTFKDVSKQAGIINSMIGYGLGLSLADLNNDGWTDVFVSNDFDEKDHIYLNNEGKHFTEVSQYSLKQMSFYSMGTDIGDINNDGWMDIVTLDMMASDNYTQKTSMSGMNPDRFYDMVDWGLHHQYMYNGLQLNRGLKDDEYTPLFSNAAFISGISQTDWSWGPLVFDMNNDGKNDLYVSNGIKRDFRNNDFQIYHRKKQEERAEEMKNQNQENSQKYIEDLLAKMPKRPKKDYFFLSAKEDFHFNDVSDRIVQSESLSNGAAYADLDNDGDLDLVINAMDDTAFIYRNNIEKNNFLKVDLIYQGMNKLGYGSKVSVYTGFDFQAKELHSTRGFQSSTPAILHFGIGNNSTVDSIKVVWPNGDMSIIENVKINNTIEVDYTKVNKVKLINYNKHSKLFSKVKGAFSEWKHIENEYNDFIKESLLPHKLSEFGPSMDIGDVNGDGLEDVYFGNAKGSKSGLFLQTNAGTFKKSNSFNKISNSKYEEVACLFFDADNDNDLDLYVATGGNEVSEGSPYLQDLLYINDGKGNFELNNALPSDLRFSSSRVASGDIDGDGDLDLVVSGRQNPGNYPKPGKTVLLINNLEKGKLFFTEENDRFPLHDGRFGMVTDVEISRINSDEYEDIILVGEWMTPKILLNDGSGRFNDESYRNIEKLKGWWNVIHPVNLSTNGSKHYILGNLGLNYKYQASIDAPFEVYMDDFDQNNSNDIVLAYHQNGEKYPVRGRQCSSDQMPFIKKKFPNYESFGSANLIDIYEKEKLDSSYSLKANNFAHTLMSPQEDGRLLTSSLSRISQMSAINAVTSFSYDGRNFIFMAGNLYASEVETPRSDSGYGVLYEIVDKELKYIDNKDHGIYLEGNVSNLGSLKLADGRIAIISAINNEYPVLYAVSDNVKNVNE